MNKQLIREIVNAVSDETVRAALIDDITRALPELESHPYCDGTIVAYGSHNCCLIGWLYQTLADREPEVFPSLLELDWSDDYAASIARDQIIIGAYRALQDRYGMDTMARLYQLNDYARFDTSGDPQAYLIDEVRALIAQLEAA